MKNFPSKFKSLRCFVFDIDGVLTKNTALALPDREIYRTVNLQDGYALVKAIQKNYQIAIISGGNSTSVKQRLGLLGIKNVFLEAKNKIDILTTFAKENDLTHEEILYMGDDLPDLDCLNWVGISSCPADAVPEIRSVCQYISRHQGGRGCVRDVISKTMKIQKIWLD